MIGDDVFFSSIRELGALLRARRLSAVELAEACLDRLQTDRPAARGAGDADARARARPGPPREPGAARGARPRAAARHPVRGQGPAGDEGHPDHLGRRAAARAGLRPRRDGGRAARAGRGGAGARSSRWSSSRAASATTTPTRASPARAARRGTPTHWSGGSSSGSAAAVAAGLVPFAIGSETSGSILTPAAFCGVTGLRPTYGLVSRHGAMTLCWTLDKLGPLARSADDCALVLVGDRGPRPEGPDDRRSLPLPRAAGGRRPRQALPRSACCATRRRRRRPEVARGVRARGRRASRRGRRRAGRARSPTCPTARPSA